MPLISVFWLALLQQQNGACNNETEACSENCVHKVNENLHFNSPLSKFCGKLTKLPYLLIFSSRRKAEKQLQKEQFKMSKNISLCLLLCFCLKETLDFPAFVAFSIFRLPPLLVKCIRMNAMNQQNCCQAILPATFFRLHSPVDLYYARCLHVWQKLEV